MAPPRRSLTGATWSLLAVPETHVERVAKTHRLSPVAARCAAIRWQEETGEAWLSPSLAHLHDPYAMAGMEEAVARLRAAIAERTPIRIITDYDVDGTTSSLILQATLRAAGASGPLDYHIPDRFSEGYGFSVAAAERAAADGIGLIVTADIGVRDHAAVSRARALGVDVLICDHHLPPGEAVPAGAIVLCPPQEACSYPNPHLAACGVSLKLAQALLADHPAADKLVRSLLKLAAIGTVADLVRLTSLENRAIVALGLAELNQGPHAPGLAALLEAAGLKPGAIRTSDLGFRVGPRINAAGRLTDATLVIRLLTSRDPVEAKGLAAELDQLNSERRTIQRRLVEQALAAVGAQPASFVVVAGPEEEGWHRGVVGIVASRLKDEVHRPAAVVSIQGELSVGSVRSVPGVHAVAALESAADLLLKFGGHPAAAGFTVRTADLDALRQRLSAYVERHAGEDALVPTREVDAQVVVDALDEGLLRELSALAPFGMGNPRPRLVVEGVHLARLDVRGSDRKHLKLTLRRGGRTLDAVWWNGAAHADALGQGPIDLLGHLEENHWRGRTTLQFNVQDARV